jgi:hypothetical protein
MVDMKLRPVGRGKHRGLGAPGATGFASASPRKGTHKHWQSQWHPREHGKTLVVRVDAARKKTAGPCEPAAI